MKKACTLLMTLFLFVIIFIGCKNDKTTKIADTDTVHFFSTKDFFLAEIKKVQATPYYIYIKSTHANGSLDSTKCDPALFQQLAQQFLAFDINEKSIKKNYNESAFRDLSTKSVTLNYSTQNKGLPIQNIDILLDEETNKVKRIFIRNAEERTDSSITRLYSWKAGKSFLINTAVVKNDGTKYAEQKLVNWDDNP